MSSRKADGLGAGETVLRALQQCGHLCSEVVEQLALSLEAGIVDFVEGPGVFVHCSHNLLCTERDGVVQERNKRLNSEYRRYL